MALEHCLVSEFYYFWYSELSNVYSATHTIFWGTVVQQLYWGECRLTKTHYIKCLVFLFRIRHCFGLKNAIILPISLFFRKYNSCRSLNTRHNFDQLILLVHWTSERLVKEARLRKTTHSDTKHSLSCQKSSLKQIFLTIFLYQSELSVFWKL